MAIDTLLNASPSGSVSRVGDIGKSAPYITLTCKGGIVTLQMPVNITSANSILWDQRDVTEGFSGNIAKNVLDAAMSGKGIVEKLTSGGKAAISGDLKNNIGSSLASKVFQAAGGDKDYFYHKQGKAVNSNKEMMFTGIGYRSFTFEWEFVPLEASEADNVKQFINFFQLHSLPDYATNEKSYFVYPDLWSINVHGIKMDYIFDSYITDYSINYGASGRMVFHPGGYPVQTNISLTFTETELHTQAKMRAVQEAALNVARGR